MTTAVRPARWRSCPSHLLPPRSCFVCGVLGPEHGPVDPAWDAHCVPGLDTLDAVHEGKPKTFDVLVMTCSAECRAAKGLVERRAVGAAERPGLAACRAELDLARVGGAA